MKKAIAYIRFSTDDQKEGNSIERQTANVEAYCRRNDLELVETLIDEGKSAYKGAHLTDGKLGKFVADLGRYRGFALLIEDLDRLSREGIAGTFELLKKLIDAGLEVHQTQNNQVIRSLNDLTTVVMAAVKSFGANDYSQKISERVGAAWKSKKRDAVNGKAITNMVPFWLSAVKGQSIVEIPERVTVVKKIFTLAENGLGARRIINQLVADGDKPFKRNDDPRRGKNWTRPYLHRLLKNRAVLGEFQPHKKVGKTRVKSGDPVPGYFPQVISQTQFDAVQEQIDAKNLVKENHGGGRYNANIRNLFSGITFNATTGKAMVYNAKSKKSPANLLSVWQQGVPQNRIRYYAFEKAFLGFLHDLDWRAVAGQTESDALKFNRAQLEQVKAEADKLARRIAVKTEAMDGDLDIATLQEFAEQIAKAKVRKTELSDKQNRLQKLVDDEASKAEALYRPEALLELVQNPEAIDLRLRLQNEIRRRIARIEFIFNATIVTAGAEIVENVTAGTGRTLVRIKFVNGSERMIILQGDKAVLLWLGPTTA